MPTNRTYSVRRYADMLMVSIRKLYRGKWSEETYSVLRLPQTDHPGIEVTYAKHGGNRAIYRVCYDPETDYRSCNCPAGLNGRACKHADNLAHLINTNRLPEISEQQYDTHFDFDEWARHQYGG